jgi:lambda family phage tail tape measure protein
MHLSNALKDEEFAQKRKELEAKAALEIAKIREEQNKKFNEIQNSMFIANSERERAFFIEKEILKLNSINAEQLKAEEEVRKQAAAKLGELAKDNNLTGAQAIEQEKLINEQMQKGLDIVRQQYEFRRNMQQDPKAGVEDRLKQIQDSVTPFKVAGQMTDSVFNSMNSALDNFVKTGKLKFSDFARSVILDLISIQLRASATQLLTQTLGMFGFNLPARALGGPVNAGQPYLVGEKGPELFLPNTSGNIVPNNKMGQGSAAGGQVVNNHYNISAIDAKGVAQLFAENRMTLLGNVRQAEKELPTRGR